VRRTLVYVRDHLPYMGRVADDLHRQPGHGRAQGVDQHPFGPFEKLLGETVYMLHGILPALAGRPDIAASVGELAESLAPLVRARSYMRMWARLPYTVLTSVGGASILLTRLGVTDERCDRLVADLLSSGLACGTERPPHRLMERRWLRFLAGSEVPYDVRDLLPLTVLWASPHPMRLTLPEAYAFTHAIWYGTDFGARPLAGMDAGGVARTVESALAWLVMAGDLDLLGEFLLCALFLRMPSSSAFTVGLRVFLGWWAGEAWEEPVETAGRGWLAAWRRALGGARPDDEIGRSLQRRYHTLYVGAVLAAALLADSSPPPTAPVGPGDHGPSDDLAQTLLAQMRRRTPDAHRRLVGAVGPGDGSVVVDGALTLAARRCDLAGVRHLLEAAAGVGLPAMLTIEEASRFLHQQEALAPDR
jgi:hypothetical protein